MVQGIVDWISPTETNGNLQAFWRAYLSWPPSISAVLSAAYSSSSTTAVAGRAHPCCKKQDVRYHTKDFEWRIGSLWQWVLCGCLPAAWLWALEYLSSDTLFLVCVKYCISVKCVHLSICNTHDLTLKWGANSVSHASVDSATHRPHPL